MSRFAEAAPFYRRYRPGIPPEVVNILDDAAPRSGPRCLLDVGTGTGLVVEGLLGRFDDIIAIDNDLGMLAAAEQVLRPALPPGTVLLLQHAIAESFTPPVGWRAGLVTICRAFHWLDQAAVLARLDAQVAPGGAVAVFGDNSLWTANIEWARAVRSIVQDFLGEQRRAGTSGTFNHHARPYSEILAESCFCEVEEIRVSVSRTWTADEVMGYLYSTSFAAPALFGERLQDFDTAARGVLAQHGGQDGFREENEFLIRIGRRSIS